MLLSPHSGCNLHANFLWYHGLSARWPISSIFFPGTPDSSQENAGDLALAAILSGPPAVPVLLAALERLEKVNGTGMVALQYLRFEDERLADLPLSTLRKLNKELIFEESATSACLRKNWTPGWTQSSWSELAGLRVTLWYAVLVERFDGRIEETTRATSAVQSSAPQQKNGSWLVCLHLANIAYHVLHFW